MASQPSDTKTIEDLEHLIASYAGDESNGPLRNGFAVYLYKKYNSKLNDATSALDSIFMQLDSGYASNKKAVNRNLKNLIDRMKTVKRQLSRDWHLTERLLMEPFRVPVQRPKIQPSDSTINTTVELLGGTSLESPHPAKKLRHDCELCLSVREECRSKCRALECKLREKKVMIRSISKAYTVKYVYKQPKILFERIAKLKNKNVIQNQMISDLKRNLASLEAAKIISIRNNEDLNLTISKLTSEVQKLNKKLQSSDEEKKEAKTEVDRLRMLMSEKEINQNVKSEIKSEICEPLQFQ